MARLASDCESNCSPGQYIPMGGSNCNLCDYGLYQPYWWQSHSVSSVRSRFVSQLDHACSKAYGMETNMEKSKVMVNSIGKEKAEISLDGQKLEEVESFKYLGSILTKNGLSTDDIRSRITAAIAALMRLHKVNMCSVCEKQEVVKTQAPAMIPIEVKEPLDLVQMDLIGMEHHDACSHIEEESLLISVTVIGRGVKDVAVSIRCQKQASTKYPHPSSSSCVNQDFQCRGFRKQALELIDNGIRNRRYGARTGSVRPPHRGKSDEEEYTHTTVTTSKLPVQLPVTERKDHSSQEKRKLHHYDKVIENQEKAARKRRGHKRKDRHVWAVALAFAMALCSVYDQNA
ncbi:hypothetical protein C0Q70_00672 [Pomacea canaliculata]|uniref:Uncharacterized protein n=1 Tax=Pomacea canaliculata TaxID=400727 RepID=A0A2T7PXB2_POMCA|nr:hypothetical protein C0Q70_00672 [Pomacea canaliculata]